MAVQEIVIAADNGVEVVVDSPAEQEFFIEGTLKGDIGLTGPQGDIGPIGPVGVGSIGPAGPTGPTGVAGVAGANGQTVLSGSGVPDAGVGVNGDYYIDIIAELIYGPKASGTWPAGVTLVGPTGPAGVAGPQGAVGSGGADTPYEDLYVDPLHNLATWANGLAAGTMKTRALWAVSRPLAMWSGIEWDATGLVLDAYVSRAAAIGKTAQVVLYSIPHRDGGGFSTGGASSAAVYQTWIDNISAKIAYRRVVVILEPDAIGQADLLNTDADRTERYSLLNYAIDKFKANNPNVRVYLDSGNPSWLGVTDAKDRLTLGGVLKSNGIALNTSNFQSTALNITYGQDVLTALGTLGKQGFIIDTSRNGNAVQQGTFNPPNRQYGYDPIFGSTGILGLHGFLWIKGAGESDGNNTYVAFDGSTQTAPAAGQIFSLYLYNPDVADYVTSVNLGQGSGMLQRHPATDLIPYSYVEILAAQKADKASPTLTGSPKLINPGTAAWWLLQGGGDAFNHSGLELWDTLGNNKWQLSQNIANQLAVSHYDGDWTTPFLILGDDTVQVKKLDVAGPMTVTPPVGYRQILFTIPALAASGPQNGSVHFDNTLNPGHAISVYSNYAGAAQGAMVRMVANSALFDKPVLEITNEGTAGSATGIRLNGPRPEIEFWETDQISPAGAFEIRVNNDKFELGSRKADNTGFEFPVTFYREANGGYVGFGTATPVERIDVVGSIRASLNVETNNLFVDYIGGRADVNVDFDLNAIFLGTAIFKKLVTLQDATDNTKQGVFDLSAITTATIRTWTMPNASGTIPTTASTSTFTNKRITERVGTVASSATITPTGDTVDLYTVTALAAAATFAAPTGTPTNGQKLMIRIKDNGTARTLAWNAIYRNMGVTLPTTTVISKTMYLGFIYNSTDTKWDLIALTQEA